MEFRNYRIGYSPYFKDFSAAADRRRFCFYAKEKGIEYEYADPNKKYDIVYVTSSSNISEWIDYKKANPATRLIFEIIDSYLLEDRVFSAYFKGIVRYLTFKDKRLFFNYKDAFINIIMVADAVVCSTPIQKDFIAKFNPKVHVSLDFFSNDINTHKADINTGCKLKLVWEGQAYTVNNLLELNNVFGKLADKIELHIITDAEIKYPIKIFNQKTADVLKKLNCEYHLHDWCKDTFSKIIASCDLSIIPMKMDNKLILNKPENKLLLLWEIGIPVLTSATPAYKRVMNEASLDYCCETEQDWENKILDFIAKSPEQIKTDMQKANQYLLKKHQLPDLISNWDSIFESVA